MIIYNTLTRSKELFVPLDVNNVKIYVCGPTVYDFAHIGNSRSIVIYDILFRLLNVLYPKVTYIRNITDIDDKIINVAQNNNQNIYDVTARYIKAFNEDMGRLNCLKPTYEPRATENIDVMLALIEKLINYGHAYICDNTVFFDIESYPAYGKLSGRNIMELIYGSRIDIEVGKKHPGDFVLWKPATDIDNKLMSCWPSPWGVGRPGWHIECSAMSYNYLGENFDIHGGGADLQFPHHENELAQSCCAFPNSYYAKYWIHNGFLTVNHEKMSKSLGNFLTVRQLLDSGIRGEVIRYIFLSTHYRKPLDWNDNVVSNAQESLNRIYMALNVTDERLLLDDVEVSDEIISCLKDDMNTPKAIAVLHEMVTRINKASDIDKKVYFIKVLIKSANFLGILYHSWQEWFKVDNDQDIIQLIHERKMAKTNGDFRKADRIRQILLDKGIVLSDNKDGTTLWYRS
ncbi:cysteine--tRNA ligase [Ehrlichia ruminantium]|uniref:Cysteine--tRNA ligase n=1 Tax=Ehrlichia ruminantium (strain Welgevonden) TaxID=254945 RepID=SYC_EHRRW|nr:cysteine--tRNA ligase [Ehrlichia ruminantium]Q5HBK5.1 RecName: Full=Cysteine--tRNA ligase; AltName: Full=Cysteinyl-tRNA synthetase; Short=CysRS [Ehrlichia ruminantium str. Welgevonden]KYW92474.1 cysteine--tRNA ligase [Ehrlichia ruminantium]QLK50401.1 cysteine--tRNA ligase [Ehrlichia ruminantium]QLK51325.1 cysteine--tRNA ligase [Ehrlichia ruminantium]QLK53161.1 cysteine--tRNA ligase [Ehrlichia ruminantium]QLK55000.1 cysteine--tRNA ligase [Ehrlichia ruminantium]